MERIRFNRFGQIITKLYLMQKWDLTQVEEKQLNIIAVIV